MTPITETPTPTEGDRLRSTAEACVALGVHRSTLTRWVAEGLIKPAVTMPGRTGAYLFDADEIARVARPTEATK